MAWTRSLRWPSRLDADCETLPDGNTKRGVQAWEPPTQLPLAESRCFCGSLIITATAFDHAAKSYRNGRKEGARGNRARQCVRGRSARPICIQEINASFLFEDMTAAKLAGHDIFRKVPPGHRSLYTHSTWPLGRRRLLRRPPASIRSWDQELCVGLLSQKRCKDRPHFREAA